MTIERGAAWGRPGVLPADGVLVHRDAEARAVVEDHRRRGLPLPALGLLGGDLARTCGATGDSQRLHGGGVVLPVDLGIAVLDGAEHCFVAHLVARSFGWRGRVVVAMNAQFIGEWDMAPRSHPNDGRLDVLETEGLAVGQRWKARRRLATGTHVPHPAILERRVATQTWEFVRPIEVRLDGTRVGRARTIELTVEPDALTVVV